MKYLLIVLMAAWSSYHSVGARSYPTPEIAKPACRFQHWDLLGPDCKMTLPRIQDANYYAFKDSILHRSVYTVLWWASYTYRRDYGLGGHPGVDIASAKGTPVRAIGNGEVVVAGWRGDRWNTVMITHQWKGDMIYSIYTHMDSVETFVGAKVSEGALIGRIGDTGNAFGNHLHFQIDRNTAVRHPFFYPWCRWSIIGIVNLGLCREMLAPNTIDPIVFLESQWADIQSDSYALNPGEFIPQSQVQEDINRQFLERNPIRITTDMPDDVIGISDVGTITIRIDGYDGILPEALTIQADTGMVDITPSTIEYIDGVRTVLINPKQTWLIPLTISLGEVQIDTRYIAVTTVSQSSAIDTAQITMVRIPRKAQQLWVIRMFDDEGNRLSSWAGTVTLQTFGPESLCQGWIDSIVWFKRARFQSCSTPSGVLTWDYQQSFSGIILFKTSTLINKDDLMILDGKWKAISRKQ